MSHYQGDTTDNRASSMMMVVLLAVVAIIAIAVIVAQPWADENDTVTPGQGGSDEPAREQQTPSVPSQIAIVVPTIGSNNSAPSRWMSARHPSISWCVADTSG